MNKFEKQLEKLINWQETDMTIKHFKEPSKTAQERPEWREATGVANDPDQPILEALEGLPDEFSNNADPKGNACCYTGCSERSSS